MISLAPIFLHDEQIGFGLFKPTQFMVSQPANIKQASVRMRAFVGGQRRDFPVDVRQQLVVATALEQHEITLQIFGDQIGRGRRGW